MEHINLDSDGEIQEPNVSAITIPDSNDEGEAVEEGELEDGEVDTNDSNTDISIQIVEDKCDSTADNSIERVEDNDSVQIVGHKDDSTSGDMSIQIVEDADEEDLVEKSEELFTVSFKSKSIFQRIGHEVINALQTAMLCDANEAINISIVPTDEESVCLKAFKTIKSTDMLGVDPESSANTPHSPPIEDDDAIKRNAKEQSPDLSGLSSLFMIDTEPAKKLDTIKVPSYKRAIKDVLNEDSSGKKKKKSDDENKCVRQKAGCFNCGSTDHSIRDCPKPRNIKRITKAKKMFSSNKKERYHIDVEQRFAHLQPGAISEKLQTALGLRRGQLPFFFYRMRVLGYPPGWLEDAKVSHSGISLFNSEGNLDNKEQMDKNNDKYDVSKIVSFPGFNMDPGSNFYDDYKYHNVPQLSKQQMKEEFIKTLGDNVIKGYKRKKLVDSPSVEVSAIHLSEQNEGKLQVTDMEIEDADQADDTNVVFSRPNPPMEPQEESVPPPPPNESNEDHSNSALDNRCESPSLEDLEVQQLKLLQELQSNTSIPTENVDDVDMNETQPEPDPNTSQENNEEPPPAPSTPTTPSTPLSTRSADIIKESHMGTPILKFSPFDKLPAGDKWAVGVSDVINFENLPDSTGKYEQMKTVIKKVRKIVTKLNNEDD